VFPVFICLCFISLGLCFVCMLRVVDCCWFGCCYFCLAVYGDVWLVARCYVVGISEVGSSVLHLVLSFAVTRCFLCWLLVVSVLLV